LVQFELNFALEWQFATSYYKAFIKLKLSSSVVDNDVLTDGILSSILCALSSPLQLDSSILRSFMQTCFKIKLPEIADSTRMLMSDIIVQIVNFTDKR